MRIPYEPEFRSDLKVLFVDDDEALGVLVRKRLAQRGHRVVLAANGDDAMKGLGAEAFDVIALDHALTGETGFDVLERLGPRGSRPPVVYVTGDADARTALAALRSGADEYVIKDPGPEFFELLIAAVEQTHERWRLKKLHDEQEKEVREARDRLETLLREVNHRIANSLGLVAAMVRMQASSVSDAAAAMALQQTQARITAIGDVHRRLYIHDKIGLVSLDDYLKYLGEELQDTMRDQARPHHIVVTADTISVSTDIAVSVGVMVSELVTNAFKYAYPPGQAGEIRVMLRKDGPSHVELRVEDDGVGFDGAQPSSGAGLGSKILKSMTLTLGAQADIRSNSNGTSASIRVPVAGKDGAGEASRPAG
jgi:two-component sensor histidine kinase